jgi:hypothetical protein
MDFGHEIQNPHRAAVDSPVVNSACIRDTQRRGQTWIIHS